MQDRRARIHRRLDVEHVREWFVVDLDQTDRVLGDVPARRHHTDYWMTLEHGDIRRHRVEPQVRRIGDRPKHADRVAALDDVRTHEDVLDALERNGFGHIDGPDPRVRERATSHRHVKAVPGVHVVGEAALAPQQPVVLLPADRGSDPTLAWVRARGLDYLSHRAPRPLPSRPGSAGLP